MKKYLHPRIEQTLLSMYVDDCMDYYVAFYGFVDFYQTDKVETMGVTIVNLRLGLLYNPDYLARQSELSLKYLLIHELYHMLFRHIGRAKNFKKNLANIAMDQIINYLIDKHYSEYNNGKGGNPYKAASRPLYHEDDFKDPKKALLLLMQGSKPGDESGCRIDPEYLALVEAGQANLVWEELYKFLEKKQQEGGQDGAPSFDEHPDLSEEQQELLNQVVKEVSEKAKQISHSRGGMPGHVGDMVELILRTSKRNNIREIARACAAMRGTVKEPSYRRPNRKVPTVKGHRRTGHAITVIGDWSGSMQGRYETVMGEIYRDGYEIMFVGADTEVKVVRKITRKEQLKTLVMQGDGTELQGAVTYVRAHRELSRNPLIVLTDGYTDTLDFTGLPKVLILSAGTEVPLVGNQRQVKQVLIGDGV